MSFERGGKVVSLSTVDEVGDTQTSEILRVRVHDGPDVTGSLASHQSTPSVLSAPALRI
jgi:hypothetical protein